MWLAHDEFMTNSNFSPKPGSPPLPYKKKEKIEYFQIPIITWNIDIHANSAPDFTADWEKDSNTKPQHSSHDPAHN